VNGCGRIASHLRSNASIFAPDGRSQIRCSALGSSAARNPLSSAVKAIPARSAWS
jgi:hypothetical protein